MKTPPEFVELLLVSLRRAVPQDGTELFHAAHDPDVMRFMDWPMPLSAANTTEHLQKVVLSWEEGLEFQWMILDHSSGEVAGTISFRPKGHAADFGYFLGREHWGKGYALEAARWVVAWLKAQPDIVRIWATADAENIRSRQLLEKLGLDLEGILRMATIRPNIGGPPRDTALYSFVKYNT